MTTQRSPLMDISNTDATSPVATTSRRKSGRTVKAPEKFIPVSQQPGAKRKRGQDAAAPASSDEEGVEGEDEGENDESEESEDESAGEEELKEKRKRTKTAKKPVAKKAKVNGTQGDEVPRSEPLAMRLPNRPKKSKKVAIAIADGDAEGLYAEVFTSGTRSDDVASQWLTRYQEDGQAALAEVVNMVLKAAGCNLKVTVDDINDYDNIEGKVTDLQEEHQAHTITEYPLVSKGKGGSAFRSCLTDFFISLLDAMHSSRILYDDPPLMENILQWLGAMSSSLLRPFRHTVVVIANTMITTLCTLTSRADELNAERLRLMNGHTKKAANKARLADFQKQIDLGTKDIEELELHINGFFNTFFMQRYRDVDSRVRTECVESLGKWATVLGRVFLDGSFLRYLGWLLSDPNAPTRHEVIKQLERLMKNPENIGPMRHLIERFRPRMIEIATRDSDHGVRSAAVNLVNIIREAGMLEPDDIDVIGKLIFDADAKVRKAVINFFSENLNELYDTKIEELGGEEVIEEVMPDTSDQYDFPRPEWIKLKCLAEVLVGYDSQDREEMPSQLEPASENSFLNLSGSESRFTLAAQALIDELPEIKDWEILAGYLLFDHSAKGKGSKSERLIKQAYTPDATEEEILLEILTGVVKISLAQADEIEKGKDKNKKKARDDVAEMKEETARHLAELLPRLLKKYGAKAETVKIVLRLEHVLNLGVFQELRQDSTAFAKLLDEISAQFSGHTDRGVLSEASAALLRARGYEELEDITENKMQSLWEETISSLLKINKINGIGIRGTFRVAALVELSNTLARIDKLASISSCIEPLETSVDGAVPIDILIAIVGRGQFEESNPDVDTYEDEVVTSAIRSSMFYFMWKTRSIMEAMDLSKGISEVDAENLTERQEKFKEYLIITLSSRASLDTVRFGATATLLDLYILFASFSPKNTKDRPANDKYANLQALAGEMTREVQAELTSIFDATEKHFARKGKKKLGEPGEDEAPEDPDSDSEDEEEVVTDYEKKAEVLKAEHQLCELTGRLVLAILAKVIDASGELKGRLRARIQRNRMRLGPNYKEVVAYLDSAKKKKSAKAKDTPASAAKGASKSAELIEDDEDEEDPFAEPEPEEGTVEDLRRRELMDEDGPESEEGEENGDHDDEEIDMLGD